MGLLNVLKDFAGGTSIHGLKYLAQTQLSTLTRVTWAYVFLTLSFYNNEPSKNKHFLILLSSLEKGSYSLNMMTLYNYCADQ